MKLSEVVGKALEIAVREAELKALEPRLEKLKAALVKLPPGDVAAYIREDREAED